VQALPAPALFQQEARAPVSSVIQAQAVAPLLMAEQALARLAPGGRRPLVALRVSALQAASLSAAV